MADKRLKCCCKDKRSGGDCLWFVGRKKRGIGPPATLSHDAPEAAWYNCREENGPDCLYSFHVRYKDKKKED